MIIMGYFIIISQLGDSNEKHKHKFYENRPIMCFGIINTHTFSGLEVKLGIFMFMLNIRYFACKL